MRNVKYLFFFLFAGLITATCTNKDETGENSWNIGGKNYEVTSCIIVEYGKQAKVHQYNNVEINLYTGTLTENNNAQRTGTGHRLRLGLISIQPTLTEGTYNYSNKLEAGLLADAFSFYITDYVNGTSNVLPKQFSSGSVTVKKSGEGYRIEFTLKDENQTSLSGAYTGACTVYVRR